MLGLSDADLNVSHLALSGILTGFILLLMRRWDGAPRIDVASVVAAVTAWFALVALLGPLSAQIRGMSLTPEKFLLTFFAAALLLPFAVVFQSLLQRDRWWQAMLLRLAARIAIIGVVVAGNVLGVFGFSGTIAVFVLLSAAFTIEPILAAYYQRSRNLVTGASLEALITGWLFVLFLPSNF